VRVGAVAAGLLLAVGTAAPARESVTGFSPARAKWERDYERRLLELPQPAECDAILRELTRTPHVAGTDANARVADFLAAEYRKAGFAVETPTYDVLLSYPRSARLEIVGEPDVALGRPEEPIAADPDSAVPESAVAWNAYSPSADVVAEAVYVNRGAPEDYERLKALGVDVRGRIAIARYFGGYRGGKAYEAERRGVAALLVYSDPIDDGWFQGPVYPDGPWGPASHFQRGANVYDFLVPGDPLTPGWASTADAKRIPASESEILPKVPMMPLSGRDAAEILKRLKGPAVPESSWQGLALPDTFRVGAGPVKLHLKIENSRERRPIRDVIATMRGTDEPDRIVLLSNHYDAWVYGAADPGSGTAAMLSLARALGRLAAQGLRPRRTVVIAEWDAEEFTLTGSTEWGEEHARDLRANAVLCLNVDEATQGRIFSPSASPLLFTAVREAARDLPDPGAAGKSVADTWREHGGSTSIDGYAAPAGETSDWPVAILGSGSDYTVFFNHLGIASADLTFEGPYGVYHSVYDSYRWMATQGDPGFLYHAAMAKLAGLLALRFANSDLLPFDAPAYGAEIARYADRLAASPTGSSAVSELRELSARARAWSDASAAASRSLAEVLRAPTVDAPRLSAGNAWLQTLEHGLIDGAGIPGRPWFRHLVYAPRPSYLAETLPGIREALEAGDSAAARAEIARLSSKLDEATKAARRISGTPERPPRPTPPRR
jgi:N-acetylated-alpha-linked acidic dipeptidase